MGARFAKRKRINTGDDYSVDGLPAQVIPEDKEVNKPSTPQREYIFIGFIVIGVIIVIALTINQIENKPVRKSCNGVMTNTELLQSIVNSKQSPQTAFSPSSSADFLLRPMSDGLSYETLPRTAPGNTFAEPTNSQAIVSYGRKVSPYAAVNASGSLMCFASGHLNTLTIILYENDGSTYFKTRHSLLYHPSPIRKNELVPGWIKFDPHNSNRVFVMVVPGEVICEFASVPEYTGELLTLEFTGEELELKSTLVPSSGTFYKSFEVTQDHLFLTTMLTNDQKTDYDFDGQIEVFVKGKTGGFFEPTVPPLIIQAPCNTSEYIDMNHGFGVSVVFQPSQNQLFVTSLTPIYLDNKTYNNAGVITRFVYDSEEQTFAEHDRFAQFSTDGEANTPVENGFFGYAMTGFGDDDKTYLYAIGQGPGSDPSCLYTFKSQSSTLTFVGCSKVGQHLTDQPGQMLTASSLINGEVSLVTGGPGFTEVFTSECNKTE